MAEVKNSSLLERLGLPDDLRWLAEKYPRENWQGHANIHGVANMWLQRHDMFRELGGMLAGGIGNYREGRLAAPDFARWFARASTIFSGISMAITMSRTTSISRPSPRLSPV